MPSASSRYKLEDSGARTLVTVNFAALLPNALKMLDRGLIDHADRRRRR